MVGNEYIPDDWSEKFAEKVKAVKAKRAKTVIDHIMEEGQIDSYELQTKYGYRHTSRAIGDVHELGIPIESFRVNSEDGRS